MDVGHPIFMQFVPFLVMSLTLGFSRCFLPETTSRDMKIGLHPGWPSRQR